MVDSIFENRYIRILIIIVVIVFIIIYILNVIKLIDKETLNNTKKDSVSVNGETIIDKDDIANRISAGDALTIVVDAGHGGKDPGKVGINKALEKDINLEIAYKLANILKNKGINIIMTREGDAGLYSESDKNKKMADLKERVRIINESKALIAISIHQNSFEEESSNGAQVFYYGGGELSEELAEYIQNAMKKYVNADNNRVHKSNISYYLLKKTLIPAVIVECGFLSNKEEANLLTKEEYQEKIAYGISNGVIEWLNALIEEK